jgi:hypothetical protein
MRRIALAHLLAVLALAPGCYALDEIDQGRAMMKKHSAGLRPEGVTPRAPEAAPQAAEAEEDAGPGLLARVQAFWAERTQRQPAERSPDDEIVHCELASGTTFTYESDCLSRGGRPAGL